MTADRKQIFDRMEEKKGPRRRIDFLDGFRGIAILSVVLYHAYCRWPSIVPYGDRFGSVLLFKQGLLGVQLFFLISGFVIFMSLEKSSTFLQYIYKRWLRLFPAMLIATVIIYATAGFLPERPSGVPTLRNVVSGLLFLEPHFIERFIGIDIGNLEGAFWSLYVEVKFYFIFGASYFLLGARRAVWCIAAMHLLWFSFFMAEWNPYGIIDKCESLALPHFGWFASGALAYSYYKKGVKMDFFYSIGIGAVSVLSYLKNPENMAFALCFLTIFIAAIRFDRLQAVFAGRFFVFLGFISYPLYLIHENAMVALIVKTGKYLDFIPSLLLPVIPIILLCAVAYLIARTLEPIVRAWIDRTLRGMRDRVQSPKLRALLMAKQPR